MSKLCLDERRCDGNSGKFSILFVVHKTLKSHSVQLMRMKYTQHKKVILFFLFVSLQSIHTKSIGAKYVCVLIFVCVVPLGSAVFLFVCACTTTTTITSTAPPEQHTQHTYRAIQRVWASMRLRDIFSEYSG